MKRATKEQVNQLLRTMVQEKQMIYDKYGSYRKFLDAQPSKAELQREYSQKSYEKHKAKYLEKIPCNICNNTHSRVNYDKHLQTPKHKHNVALLEQKRIFGEISKIQSDMYKLVVNEETGHVDLQEV